MRYVSRNGGGASDGALWISYNFTSGNWRGEVEESVLDVKLPRGAYLLPMWDNDKLTWTSCSQRNGNRFRFHWNHWQAQKNFHFNYYPTFPNELLKHMDSASIASGAKPRYEPASSDFPDSALLPFVRGNALPDCVLQNGRLWVSARAFSPRWDEKRRGVVLTSGNKHAFVSARGAMRRSSWWPLAPNGAFWISCGGDNHVLMVPAREVALGLGGRFGLHRAHGQAVWVQGTVRKILRANPRG